MASISPHASGYRVQVFVNGVRDSKIFRTKREASAWGSARESEIRAELNKTEAERYTLRDAFNKYALEVSPKKKGYQKELIRLKAFCTIFPVDSLMCEVTTTLLAKWRDNRLSVVKPGSVLRDFNLLSDVFNFARREWGWIKENPLSDVRRPPQPPHRTRVILKKNV